MKPQTPKGTRDFLPGVVRKRNYIFDTIRAVYELYGYEPIETPAMENLETLTGKYGDEGDRLIFKILRRDQKLEKALAGMYDSPKYSGAASGLSRKAVEAELSDFALRYDLTVPFARFVVAHQNELTFPFRRYQIQPVWRADRPQRGRYREFYQCDADIVGTDSLRCEAEFVQIIDEVFTRLGIPVEVRLNNRKILAAMARYAGVEDRLTAMTVAIDKLDKMPRERVLADLAEQGFASAELEAIAEVLDVASKADALEALETRVGEGAENRVGFDEMRSVMAYTGPLQSATVRFDASLARGLNYYTGTIIEVVPRTDRPVGSICGGGRYDDLTGIFGMSGVSGVGISFGADRIYDILESENGFPEGETTGTRLLFANLGDAPAARCVEVLADVRRAGIRAELYPDTVKMKKQMKYANDKQIPFVALIGDNELKNRTITLKDMGEGEQYAVDIQELIEKLRD